MLTGTVLRFLAMRYRTLASLLVMSALLQSPASGTAATTELVSADSGGTTADSDSIYGAVSDNGRWVAFESDATDLVLGDTNGTDDVFLRDTLNEVTTRISVKPSGGQVPDSSHLPQMSPDGRYIVFESYGHLVRTDTDSNWDIFLYDRVRDRIEMVSIRSNGNEATTGGAYEPSVSADGRFVAFSSTATDLVSTDGNGLTDVFVHDRETGRTRRVSVRSDGAEAVGGESAGPQISPDGRWIVYRSAATNLVGGDAGIDYDIFLYDRIDRMVQRVSDLPGSAEPDSGSAMPGVSNGGDFVIFYSDATDLVPADTNGDRDVFVWTRETRETERVSVRANGAQLTYGAPCALGRSNISMSSNGRYVVFDACESLVPRDDDIDRDVYVRDLVSDTVRLVSVDPSGANLTDGSESGWLSRNGAWVVWESDSVFVPPDTDGYYDIFLRGPLV